MSDYQVVVIGAGPAGLSASQKLAQSGISVLCLDKKQELGAPKRCAEGIGGGWFKRLGLKPKPSFITSDIYGVSLVAPSGKTLEIRFPEISGHVIERKIFEKELAAKAAKDGAKIFARHSVEKATRENGKIKLLVESFDETKEITCDAIISAEGIESKIPRQLGVNTVHKLINVDSGFQYEMANIDFENPDLINMFFGNDIAPRGYTWIFPKSEGTANVGIGIGGNNTHLAKKYLDKFVQSHPGLKDGSIIEVNSGVVPVGGFMDDMTADNMIVVGDAAHQVDPIHGGGIGLAIESARLAADHLIECINSNDLSHKALSGYNAKWYEQRGNELMKRVKWRHVFENLDDKHFNEMAKAFTGKEILDLVDGKLDIKKLALTKLVSNPGLVSIMLKTLGQ